MFYYNDLRGKTARGSLAIITEIRLWTLGQTFTNDAAKMRPVTKITVFGKRLAILVLGVYWLFIFAGTHMPSFGEGAPRVNDKIKHFTAYFLLGGLMCYVTTSNRYLHRFGTIALVGMAYGAIDEFTQRFVPGRSPDVMDFLADAAGLWMAITIYVLAKCIYGRQTEEAQIS